MMKFNKLPIQETESNEIRRACLDLSPDLKTRVEANSEVYYNEIFIVNVYRNAATVKTSKGDVLIHSISIRRIDETANVSWMDKYEIKNAIIGEENEAIEMFPAAERLINAENAYHLMCLADPKLRFPYGLDHLLMHFREDAKLAWSDVRSSVNRLVLEATE